MLKILISNVVHHNENSHPINYYKRKIKKWKEIEFELKQERKLLCRICEQMVMDNNYNVIF